MRAIHERTLVICMIETRAGLDNVEAIAAVDGVDVIWLGHFDLTNFLGIPGQFSHPQYRDAVKRIVADARRTRQEPPATWQRAQNSGASTSATASA